MAQKCQEAAFLRVIGAAKPEHITKPICTNRDPIWPGNCNIIPGQLPFGQSEDQKVISEVDPDNITPLICTNR